MSYADLRKGRFSAPGHEYLVTTVTNGRLPIFADFHCARALVHALREAGDAGMADWLALMGGFCFALTNILLRKLNQTPQASRMLAMFAGGTLMSLSAATFGLGWGVVTPPPALGSWVGLALLVCMVFLAGNLALQYGAPRLSAGVTSIILLSEVVFASVSAVILGAGDLSARTVFGGSLILLASLLAVLSFARR